MSLFHVIGRAGQHAFSDLLPRSEPRHALGAAKARHETQASLRQADFDIRIVHCKSGMASQRHLESTAKAMTIDRRGHGLAACFQRVKTLHDAREEPPEFFC